MTQSTKTLDELRQEAQEAEQRRKAAEKEADLAREAVKAAERNIRKERTDLLRGALLDNAALLDTLAPEHSRKSCTDSNNVNSEHGCVRCYLLDLKNYTESSDTELVLEVRQVGF